MNVNELTKARDRAAQKLEAARQHSPEADAAAELARVNAELAAAQDAERQEQRADFKKRVADFIARAREFDAALENEMRAQDARIAALVAELEKLEGDGWRLGASATGARSAIDAAAAWRAHLQGEFIRRDFVRALSKPPKASSTPNAGKPDPGKRWRKQDVS